MSRALAGKQTLLRIFFGENDLREGKPLQTALIEKARELGVAGCTVFRGASGFGPSGQVHSDFPPDYAEDLPVVVEIVDTSEQAEAFMTAVESWLEGKLVTEEKLLVNSYRRAK